MEEINSLSQRVLEDIYSIPRYKQVTSPNDSLEALQTPGEQNALLAPEDVIERLAQGEPVQYIAGFEYFCGEKFNVGSGVLIPRPETEELVNKIVAEANSHSELRAPNALDKELVVLDLCTGSGCIAWSLWKGLPNAKVFGCDISDVALQYAVSQNITRVSRASEQIPQSTEPVFFKQDILSNEYSEELQNLKGKVDILVSNPPYIAESEKKLMHKNVLEFEPSTALFVTDDNPLLFYKRIAELGKELLTPTGKIYLEINPLFASELKQHFEQTGYSQVPLLQDITGKQRFAVARELIKNQD
ncbi:MAG: peptide chain release factor N(5)-glutamine methyltransferase [Bacteroidales bacterium]|nr:peptide chain release factor N(5)-glutamine methyltransferase [Bacteroidales bacterium]